MAYGKLRYRLQIEGWPDEWVTDIGLVATLADGRQRRLGLMLDGLEIQEDLNLRDGTIEASPITATIRSRYAAESFAKEPVIRTWLTAALSKDAAGISVQSTSATSVGDILHIGTEAVQVSSTPGDVVRQMWDTQQQAHSLAYGDDTEQIPLWEQPPSMEGRRAYIFRYMEYDTTDSKTTFDFTGDVQGGTLNTDDTIIWRGLVSGAPRLASADGLSWSIDIEPITMVLEQELAAASDTPAGIAGIYHSVGAPFIIYAVDYATSPPAHDTPIQICGQWDSESEFIATVNSALATVAANAFTKALTRLELQWSQQDEAHALLLETPAATAVVEVGLFSALEGVIEPYWHYATGVGKDAIIVGHVTLPQSTEFYKSFFSPDQFNNTSPAGIVFGKYWGHAFEKKPRFPRGALGHAPSVLGKIGGKSDLTYKQSQSTTYPDNRIYLSGTLNVNVGDTVILKNVMDPGTIGGQIPEEGFEVKVTTAAVSYIGIDLKFSALALNADTEIYAGAMYKTNANVGGFIDAVVDRAPNANNGSTPFITYSDINNDATAGWEAVVDNNVSHAAIETTRRFAFQSPVLLRDVLREELKLIGCYMHLSSDGRIAISPLEVPTTNDLEAVSITDADIITPYGGVGGYPEWEPGRDGVVGTVEIATEYNPVTDEHGDDRYIYRNVRTISTHKNRSRGTTTIEPRSRYVPKGVGVGGRQKITADEGKAIAKKYFAVHGHDYHVVTLQVRLGLMDTVFCGSTVRVTSRHIINPAGTTTGTATGMRGVTNLAGWVIARRFPFDPSGDAVGELVIRFNSGNVRGYSPAARITSAVSSGGAGLVWDLQISKDFFSPADKDDADYFAADYRIRVTEFDDSAPVTEVGVVTTVTDATSIRVTMDGVPGWGASPAIGLTYDMTFEEATGAPTTAQQEYCYIADANGKLVSGNTSRVFA